MIILEKFKKIKEVKIMGKKSTTTRKTTTTKAKSTGTTTSKAKSTSATKKDLADSPMQLGKESKTTNVDKKLLQKIQILIFTLC